MVFLFQGHRRVLMIIKLCKGFRDTNPSGTVGIDVESFGAFEFWFPKLSMP